MLFIFGGLTVSGCTGPGLEPPDGKPASRTPPTGGAGGAAAGTTGGNAGTTPPNAGTGGTGGFANAGEGGVCSGSGCAGTGAGAAGMMATAGGVGGAGGSSGTASGTGGAMSPDDAGGVDAPELTCATGRDAVEVEVIDADAAVPVCVLTLPESAREHAPGDLSIAITTNTGGTTETLRIAQADAWRMCDLSNDSGAYYPLTLAAPTKIELCPDVCELASQDGALIELVYGCTVDFNSEMP